jgi:hypothetical protein
MQYVLGNMLNGGGINPDGLSLDLQFAADKTLTARRGPTPTFIRSSGDNGGTTYFGPLVDFDLLGEIPTTGITNGRASWFKSDGGNDITISYTGTGWRVIVEYDGNEDEYLAATGGEWRPDQADWSGVEFSVTTSSTFGIVKAANNEPRFDHTSAGDCRGLLIEEGRTNLIPQSDNFASASWIKGGGSISSVANIEPDGSANSELFSEDGANSVHRTFQSFTGVSSTVYTLSVFLKFSGRQYVYLENRSINTNPFVVFDIQNGTVFSTIGPLTSTIQAYPNGWYRCSVTGTANLAGGNYLIGGYSGGSQSYTGLDGPAFYLYGAQVEAGSFPTSYIPTTTGTLARSADLCSITGANFTSFYNQSEGTFFVAADPRVGTGFSTYLMANSGANADQVSIFRDTVLDYFGVANGGSYTAQQTVASANGSFNKIAGSYFTNDARSAFNGILASADTSVTVPTNLNRLNIGSSSLGNTQFANGCLSSIRYFKKRLPNAKLVTLTT